ncbi:MAG: hypothetical protein FIA98_02260 [Anaerolineae bacterium]|nr:hypothetical protein [Anaerolineae bacterium]
MSGLFKHAQVLGSNTSLDASYDPTAKRSGVIELQAVTDVFLDNEAEACLLTGEVSVEDPAILLYEQVKPVAIKLGGMQHNGGEWGRTNQSRRSQAGCG